MSTKPTKVADNVVVTLTYTVRLDDGELIDSADASDPLFYLHGHENIVPGLEKALVGLTIGDKKKVVVSPEEGYGEYDPDDIEEMPRSEFPDDFEFEEGMELDLYDADNDETYEAAVIEVGSKTVTLDFNHPLAGETLHFEVEILDLRQPTAEELEHGHVHDDDED